VQWKKVRFMADKVGDQFEGYITGVSAYGLYVELVEHFVEGMVHVSTMADDYYRFLERAHVLRGENNRREYRLGDRVTVQVIRVDLEQRQIDLGLMEILEAVRGQKVGRRPSQRRPAAARAAETRDDRRRSGRRQRGSGRRERGGRGSRKR
jgi:ribonuclease R